MEVPTAPTPSDRHRLLGRFFRRLGLPRSSFVSLPSLFPFLLPSPPDLSYFVYLHMWERNEGERFSFASCRCTWTVRAILSSFLYRFLSYRARVTADHLADRWHSPTLETPIVGFDVRNKCKIDRSIDRNSVPFFLPLNSWSRDLRRISSPGFFDPAHANRWLVSRVGETFLPVNLIGNA